MPGVGARRDGSAARPGAAVTAAEVEEETSDLWLLRSARVNENGDHLTHTPARHCTHCTVKHTTP